MGSGVGAWDCWQEDEIILVTGSAAGCEVTGEAEVQEERLSRQRLRQLLELLFKISD